MWLANDVYFNCLFAKFLLHLLKWFVDAFMQKCNQPELEFMQMIIINVHGFDHHAKEIVYKFDGGLMMIERRHVEVMWVDPLADTMRGLEWLKLVNSSVQTI